MFSLKRATDNGEKMKQKNKVANDNDDDIVVVVVGGCDDDNWEQS